MKAMPIKVLVVSSYLDNWNAVRPEGEMFIALARAGIEMTIMTQGDSPYAERFRQEGLRVIDHHPAAKYQPETIRLIRQEIMANGFHILHLFNNKAIVNGILAARKLPVKVLTYRGYTGNIHWWNPFDYLTHLHPRVDAVTCVSAAIKEVFERQLFFPAGKAQVVTKGHDPAWYAGVEPASLQPFGFPEGAIVVSVVANARRMKGIPVLLEATFHLPLALPVYFLLIGRHLDDPATLKLLRSSPYRDRFVFAGYRKDVLSLVKACDLSVLPSVKGEGLSKTLLESLFLGKPTIMTDIAGNRGLAEPGESGLIVPAKDAGALAEAITRLANDAVLRERMGRAGARHVTAHFSLSMGVTQMKSLYERLAIPFFMENARRHSLV